MSEPPLDGGPGQPDAGEPSDPSTPDYSSPSYNGAPEDAGDDGPRRSGAHRAGGRPTPPPPPPAGAPYWPQPDYQPDEPLKRPLIDTLPLRLLQAGAAVLLVAILIFVFVQVFGSKTTGNDAHPAPTTHKATATKTGTPATTSGAATSGSVTPDTTSAPAKTTAPATKPTGKPTATKSGTKPPTTKPPTTKPPTTKPPATPTAKPTTAAPPPVDVKAPLLVLNNSRIHGLALTGKATFEQGGWTVTGTGNFGGRLPRTTVFYGPGLKAAAETLARQFPTVTDVLPRPAGVPGSSLTVVLTRYFKP